MNQELTTNVENIQQEDTSSETKNIKNEVSTLTSIYELCQALMYNEAETLKWLGVKHSPLGDCISKYFGNKMGSEETPIDNPDIQKCGSLESLLQSFLKNVTLSAKRLHETVEEVPQNRPFGGCIYVERLLCENLSLMSDICDLDMKVNHEKDDSLDIK
jgi:hypothetical protein